MEKWVGETNIKHWLGVTAKINSLSSGVGWRQINKNHIILEILIQLVKEIFGHNIKMIDWLIDWLIDWSQHSQDPDKCVHETGSLWFVSIE